MENRDIIIMACHGFSLLGRLESPFSNLFIGGEHARIYPVIMIRHICMPNLSKIQNPLPHALTAFAGPTSPQIRAMIKVITVRIHTMTNASGTHLSVQLVRPPPQFFKNSRLDLSFFWAMAISSYFKFLLFNHVTYYLY
jgi:hypothetical protein